MSRVVAITGGARGIGRATAEACVRAGMRVAVGDRDAALAGQTAAELGDAAVGLHLDVTDEASFARFLDEAEARLGPLDVLVNNAGVLFVGPYARERPERTRRMLDVNVVGVLTGSRLALQRFAARRRGHIVNLASSAGQIPVPGGATYAATKHAVVGFTRALRVEAREAGVLTTLVMPGIVRSEMAGGFAQARGTRYVEVADVAAAIVRALDTGRAEVFVPRELGIAARLVAGLPPRASEALRRVLGGDVVMGHADLAAREAYERRAET